MPAIWFGGDTENSDEIQADIISDTSIQKKEFFDSNFLQSNLQLVDSPGQEFMSIPSYKIHDKRALSNVTQFSLIEAVERGHFNVSESADFYIEMDIVVRENYAFVAEYTKGIQIIDISNPREPILVGSYAENDFPIY